MAFNLVSLPQISINCNNNQYVQSRSLSPHTPQSTPQTYNVQQPSNFVVSDVSNRVVFISLIGLYESWRDCPMDILNRSIFILPLKKEWIWNQPQSRLWDHHHDFQRFFQDHDFIKLLRWKDENKLLFWMEDNYFIPGNDDHNISPFWIFLSHRLQRLHYNPLILDTECWRTR
eukprot:13109_1